MDNASDFFNSLLEPTEADARDVMVSEIEPIFEATPALKGLLSPDASEDGRNTLLSRRFPSGSLRVVPAKAPRNLRRMTARILLCDEIDAMESGAEGSPLILAERRTLSFGNRKIVMGSTPIYEETSHILRAYGQSDRRVFQIECPDCHDWHEVLWKDVFWEEGKPETAHHVCPACGSVIEERQKAGLIEGGRWRATAPEVKGHAGFKLNCLVSVHENASWGKLAVEFLTAKSSPDTLQTFVNTILAAPWKIAAEELDGGELAARAEPFGLKAIPPEVLVVTVGVDVQRDRLHCLFLGHGRAETFVLGESIIWGVPEEDSTWQELDELLKTTWPHPIGRDSVIRIDAVAIDSGDGQTVDAVLGFTKHRFGKKVVAVKGVAGARPQIVASKTKGSKLFIVGVDGLKAQIASRLTHGKTIRFVRI